ncbi:MAG: CIA30 family protein [Ferruginibacter sp.]|nr:CIA30 family protein [Ferruginibacter sp.]
MQPIFIFSLIMMLKASLIFDFNTTADISKWRVTDDVVMGGRSNGNFQLNAEGYGLFSGKVSLENNGGFSSVRYYFPQKETTGFNKFVIRLKGDGKQYQLRVKAMQDEYFDYIILFATTGEWQTLELPFYKMVPSFRGQLLNRPPFPGTSMLEIGFLIGNKKAESFALELDEILIQ